MATLPSKMLYHRVVAEVIGEDATLFVSRRSGNILPEIMVRTGNVAAYFVFQSVLNVVCGVKWLGASGL